MKMEETVRQLFVSFPDIKELYLDVNGNYWTNKETAQAQSNGGKVTTLKRNDYVKSSKVE